MAELLALRPLSSLSGPGSPPCRRGFGVPGDAGGVGETKGKLRDPARWGFSLCAGDEFGALCLYEGALVESDIAELHFVRGTRDPAQSEG